jgi:hypothetical protein
MKNEEEDLGPVCTCSCSLCGCVWGFFTVSAFCLSVLFLFIGAWNSDKTHATVGAVLLLSSVIFLTITSAYCYLFFRTKELEAYKILLLDLPQGEEF